MNKGRPPTGMDSRRDTRVGSDLASRNEMPKDANGRVSVEFLAMRKQDSLQRTHIQKCFVRGADFRDTILVRPLRNETRAGNEIDSRNIVREKDEVVCIGGHLHIRCQRDTRDGQRLPLKRLKEGRRLRGSLVDRDGEEGKDGDRGHVRLLEEEVLAGAGRFVVEYVRSVKLHEIRGDLV